MSQSRAVRAIRESGYLMAGQLAMGGVGLFTSAWLARNLVAAELAVFPAALTLESIAYAFTGLGMYDGFVRKATPLLSTGNGREAEGLLKTGLWLTVAASVIFCLGLYLWRGQINELLLDGSASPLAMQLIPLVVLPRVILRHVWGTMNAIQEYRWIATTRATEHVLRATGSVAFYLIWGITGSLVALSIGSAIGIAFTVTVLKTLLSEGGRWAGIRYTLSVGWPYFAAALCSNLTSRVDYFIVGALGGASPLATYFVAQKIYEYLDHLSRNLMDTMQTKIAEQTMVGPSALGRSFALCTRYFFLGLVPLYFASAALSSVIVAVYAGGNYSDAGTVLAVLCAAGLVRWFSEMHRRFVLVAGKRWHPLLLDTTALLSSGAFVALFMLLIGPIGAALGKMLVGMPILILSSVLLSRVFRPKYDTEALEIGLGSGVAVFALTQTLIWLLPPIVGAIVGVGAILPIYYVFVRRRLHRGDLDMVFEVVPICVRRTRQISMIESFLRRNLLVRTNEDMAAN